MCERTCWNCEHAGIEPGDTRVCECSVVLDDEQFELAQECEYDESIMPTICKSWEERKEDTPWDER